MIATEHHAPRPRGNPAWHALRDHRVAVERARRRFNLKLAREAWELWQGPTGRARDGLTAAETAAILNERGRRTFRGKPLTADSVRRLVNWYWPRAHFSDDRPRSAGPHD